MSQGHDWGGDFALYLNQTQALLEGSLQELYKSNQFTVEKSDRLIGPYLYPMGYPLLLSPLMAALGMNFYALKVYTNLFFYLGLVLLFRLIKPHFKSLLPPLLLIACLAFSEYFLFHGDQLLSDFPFFFFVMLCLNLFKKKQSSKEQIVLGSLIFFTYLIRELGVMLLPALFIFQLKHHSLKELLKSKYQSYLSFVVLLLLSFLLFPFGSRNHLSLFVEQLSWESFSMNIDYYADLLETYLRGVTHYEYLPYLLAALFLAGIIYKLKKLPHWISFFLLSILVLLLWPYHQGVRFIFVSLPFLFFFILSPLESVPKWPRFLLVYPFFVFLSWGLLSETLAQNQKNLALETNQIYQAENIALYDYLNQHYTENDTIVFFKPRVLRMFCGVKSLYLQPDSFMQSPYPTLITSPWFPPRGIDSGLFVTNFGPYGIFQKTKIKGSFCFAHHSKNFNLDRLVPIDENSYSSLKKSL